MTTMRQYFVLLACLLGLAAVADSDPPSKHRLLIAFSSYKDRPKHPQISFYEHDGVSEGKIIGSIDTVTNRSDYHPTLSVDGRYCAFASELENQTSKIFFWDREEKKLVDLPQINASPNALLHPSLSGDGKWLIFAGWNRPGATQRWDLALYDVMGKKFQDLPGCNTPKFDERMPCFSGDGRVLAFTSNSKDGVGLSDIYLYDREASKILAVPEMNSPHMEITPSLNADGTLVAFVSDRPGGQGGRDIYLFDRKARKLVPLPGLNSVAHEQTPSLSPDGRFIAFVSERRSGLGERDVYLYDREAKKLLPTPGLNSKREDIDPCIIAP
jgi:Tol biopolymer transport system component